MQNGGENKPYYPYGSAMNGYSTYAASVSPSSYAPFSPAKSTPTPPPASLVQDPDLLPASHRYGTNGNARETPPSDALLQGYTSRLENGSNYNGHNNLGLEKAPPNKLLDANDSVAMHLLVESALGDSSSYDVLSFDEVDRLKKELASLEPRIETLRKKLALESKVRDAAASLNRLYDQNGSSSATTNGHHLNDLSKQHPEATKTEEELASANKKCADISRELYSLETRQQRIQVQILTHTAGVLQMTHRGPSAKRQLNEFPNSPQHGMLNGARPDSPVSIYTYDNGRNEIRRGDRDDFDERSLYKAPDDTYGFSIDNSANAEKAIMQDVAKLGSRLDDLNTRLKQAIMQASTTRDVTPLEAPNSTGSATSIASVNRQLDAISGNFDTLSASQHSSGMQVEQLQHQLQQKARQLEDAINQKDRQYEDVLDDRNRQLAIAQKRAEQLQAQLEDTTTSRSQMNDQVLPSLQQLHNQLYNVSKSAMAASGKGQQVTPPNLGNTHPNDELNDIGKSLNALSTVMQDLAADIQTEKDHSASVRDNAAKLESSFTGLWSAILASEEKDRQQRKAIGQKDVGNFNAKEPFSPQGFNARLQGLLSQRTELREQLLRSESEHTANTRNLQDELQREKDKAGQAMAAIQGERDSTKANNARTIELEKQLEAKTAEVARIEQVLEANRATTAERQNTLQELRQKISSQDEELEKLRGSNGQEIERLENELVRLTTDLTFAKAELDAAYGSRAERKAEADAESKKQLDDLNAQIAALKSSSSGPSSREKELEDELKDTLKEFEELTRASVEAEKERDKLEAHIDTISQKLEEVEAQLSEEKVKWLGVKNLGDGNVITETASISTMRAEFKKMMRDQRAEGIKALRTEQEERRKVEAQLRQLRKDREVPKKSGLSNLLSLN